MCRAEELLEDVPDLGCRIALCGVAHTLQTADVWQGVFPLDEQSGMAALVSARTQHGEGPRQCTTQRPADACTYPVAPMELSIGNRDCKYRTVGGAPFKSR